MAATAAIVSGVVSVGSGVYQGIEQRKAAKRSADAQAAVLASRPDANAQAMDAAAKSLSAEQTAKKKAAGMQGYASTILTSPSAAPTAPPARKTLLGQ